MSNVLLVLAQSDWNDHHDFGDGWWIVMMIGMIAFWVIVALAIVWAVRHWSSTTSTDRHDPDGDDPLKILDRRLAEGEVSVEEYSRRRDLLAGGPGTA